MIVNKHILEMTERWMEKQATGNVRNLEYISFILHFLEHFHLVL